MMSFGCHASRKQPNIVSLGPPYGRSPLTQNKVTNQEVLLNEHRVLREEVISNSKTHTELVKLYIIGMAAFFSFVLRENTIENFSEIKFVPIVFALSMGLFVAYLGYAINQIGTYLRDCVEPSLMGEGAGWETYLEKRRARTTFGFPVVTFGIFAIFLAGFSASVWALFRF